MLCIALHGNVDKTRQGWLLTVRFMWFWIENNMLHNSLSSCGFESHLSSLPVECPRSLFQSKKRAVWWNGVTELSTVCNGLWVFPQIPYLLSCAMWASTLTPRSLLHIELPCIRITHVKTKLQNFFISLRLYADLSELKWALITSSHSLFQSGQDWSSSLFHGSWSRRLVRQVYAASYETV